MVISNRLKLLVMMRVTTKCFLACPYEVCNLVLCRRIVQIFPLRVIITAVVYYKTQVHISCSHKDDFL